MPSIDLGKVKEVTILRTTAQGAPTHPAVPITAIGQKCRVGDAAPYAWYRAETLTSWELDIPSAESVLELLEGQPLEPETLVLPDFEDSTPPNRAIGLSGGRLSLGDGVTPAGKPLTPRRVAGVKVFDLVGTNKSSARFAIIGIPLTASEVVVNSVVNISGSVKILFSESFYVTEEPVISTTIGFAHNAFKTDPTTKWVKYNSLPNGSGEYPHIISHDIAGDFQIATNATPGPNHVALYQRYSVIRSDRWEGAPSPTIKFNDYGLSFVNATDLSTAVMKETADTLWLSVEIVMGSSGTNTPAVFRVIFDLDTSVQLP